MNKGIQKKIAYWVQSWKRKGYPEDIPDEAPTLLEDSGRVPSYRMIVKAILKNDKTLQTLGYGRSSCELYMLIKREELQAKGKRVWTARQTRMF